MRIFDSKPGLRWMAPVAFLLVAAGGGLVAVNASAEDTPPPQTAEELLVDLQQPKVDAFSGTIVQTSNLGIPAIPSVGGGGGGGGGTSDLTSLLSGTHNLQVWYSGPDKARVALKSSDLAESDVVTNGSDVWTWSSDEQSATHRTIDRSDRTAHQAKPSGPADTKTPMTPQEAAAQVLKTLGPSTNFTTDKYVTVAKQEAYELVLRPKDARSKLKEVRIAIDGDTHLPLRVQAFGDKDTLVFEVGYTSVSFDRPNDATFAFNPPPGTKVTEAPKTEHKAPTAAERTQAKQRAEQAKDGTKTVGTGWTTVVVAKLPADAGKSNRQLQAFLEPLSTESGSWGSGKLLVGTAFSAVLTDDGRVAVGAVPADMLYAALEK